MAKRPLLLDSFETIISKDLLRMIAGDDPISEGQDRIVFPYLLDDKYVVKFEVGAARFQNIIECGSCGARCRTTSAADGLLRARQSPHAARCSSCAERLYRRT